MRTHPMTPPNRTQFWALALLVLAVHGLLLLTAGDSLWRFPPASQKLGPLQTRVIAIEPLAVAPKLSSALPQPVRKPRPAPFQRPNDAGHATQPGLSAVATPNLPEPAMGTVPTDAYTEAHTEAPTHSPTPASPDVVSTAANNAEGVDTTAPRPATPIDAQDTALNVKVGNFPDNIQLNYKLTGQERGLAYYANGSLKWQVKPGSQLPKAYEAELRVKAFLIGSRIWRSVGVLTESGLAPQRYSDSWRGERAAHFDADSHKISFSSNAPSAQLETGAQDQVSLFVQMAAAVSSQNFKPGAALNVQTATTRDAVNWRLTYKADEGLDIKGERVETQRWVCLPRGKFDSQIEMWLSKLHGGMPVRIKISQVSGNFIDMEMSSSEALPALAD